jgi:hypothetical protein
MAQAKKTEINYSYKDLEYLKELFYNIHDVSKIDNKKLNISLNLFYGYPADDNIAWKKAFEKSVITGKIKTKNGKQKLIYIEATKFKNLSTDDLIASFFNKKQGILNKLTDLYTQNEIDKTVIYEAPPYLLLIEEDPNEIHKKLVSEFILDDRCDSPYSNAIKNCFNVTESPLEPEEPETLSKILKSNKCGFFDVIPLPLPINKDLRNKWATENKYFINEKRIFVHFFEWAIENYFSKVKKTEGEHKLAVGIPLNNAITLYEYYDDNTIKSIDFELKFNNPHSKGIIKQKKAGLWIQPYKNCIISTSNTPNGDLMKLAFDL